MTGYDDFGNPFEIDGKAEWLKPEDFQIEDNSEDADADYHYSVKVGTYGAAAVYCNVSGYFDGNDEPQIYSDDNGKAFFRATMIDMPDGMLEQVFELVKPQLEATRAEFEKTAAERENR